jgi:hypothetical protein
MQQLQTWADEGRYDFEGKRFRTPYGWVDYDQLEPMSVQMTRAKEVGYRITQEGLDAIRHVLDGTIQVWRPVGKYDPIFDAELYLCLGKDGEQYIGDITYFEEKKGATRSYCVVLLHNDFSDHKTYLEITHYQPLPQPPQEVSDATD